MTDKHVSMALSLKIFDAVLLLSVLPGLHTLPLTQAQLHKIHASQRRMLRSMVGRVRHADEDLGNRHETYETASDDGTMHTTWRHMDAPVGGRFAYQIPQFLNWACWSNGYLKENWQTILLHGHIACRPLKWDDRLCRFVACKFPMVEMWTDVAGDAC